MKKTTKIIKDACAEQEITYTLIETGSDKICFMFSGLGYTYDKPLFYYATMLMLEKNIDVVQVHYSYDKEFLKQPAYLATESMMNSIQPIMDVLLKNTHYKKTFFLGKSLGTIPIVNGIMKNNSFPSSKIILLTPLLKMDEMFKSIIESKHEGILVIGDKDQHYDLNKLEQMKQTSLQVDIIKDANHSLDIAELDTVASIAVISRVMKNIVKIVE
ncbi:MAG: alpha/beta hydrolase [Bacillus sp. (in: firmicutes)]